MRLDRRLGRGVGGRLVDKRRFGGPAGGILFPSSLRCPGAFLLLGEALNGLLILGVESFDAPLDVCRAGLPKVVARSVRGAPNDVG